MTSGRRTSVSLSDSEVIALSAEQPAAFTDIFERYFQSIFVYLIRRVGVREEAEDLASQTFVIAFEKRATFRPHLAGALPWLYGIATNLISEHRRREIRGIRALAKHNAVAAHRGVQEVFNPKTEHRPWPNSMISTVLWKISTRG
jgi:DNA-directed RNA polymerase specialized sigma24 family protein